MTTLEEVLREEMKDPEFKREWDALEPEFQLIQQQLDEEKRKRNSLSSSVNFVSAMPADGNQKLEN